MEKLQTWTRVLLIIWFIVVSLYILIPSYVVLQSVKEQDTAVTQTAQQLPTPPPTLELPAFDKGSDKDVQQKQIQSRVDAYQHQVTAYSHQLTAYKAQVEALGKPPRLAVYQAVVKDTLVSLITGLLTALVGYVFVKESAKVAKEYIQAKSKAADGS